MKLLHILQSHNDIVDRLAKWSVQQFDTFNGDHIPDGQLPLFLCFVCPFVSCVLTLSVLFCLFLCSSCFFFTSLFYKIHYS